MSSVLSDPQFSAVASKVKSWPAPARQALANEILSSLKDEAIKEVENWSEEKNARRCELIDREFQGALTDEEKVELELLQAQAIAWRDMHAPLPIDDALKLHGELLKARELQTK